MLSRLLKNTFFWISKSPVMDFIILLFCLVIRKVQLSLEVVYAILEISYGES
jgi:hypothetical protein